MSNAEVKIQKQSNNNDHCQTPRRLLRIRQIIGDKDNPGILPISKSSWWKGVKEGRYPQPLHLSPRTTVWKSTDIDALVNGNSGNEKVVQDDHR